MKKHFKLYKSGKKWVTTAIVSFVAITGLSLGVAHADTNNDVVSSPETASVVKNDVDNTVATPSNVKTNDEQSDKTVSTDSINESTIATHAAQQSVQNGWTKNDSGQWTYYTNGQVQTGRSYSYLPTVGSNQGHNWYLVDNGVVQSKVQPWAGSYYYFDPATYLRVDNDYRQSQWGDWYMFGNDGRVVGGKYTYQNKTYYANPQTYLRERNQYVPTQSDGSGLLLGNDGAALSGVQSWNGRYYYFNPNTYLRANQRNYVQSQWGDWYLIGDNGQVLSGVQQWAGTYYYFDPVTYLRVDNNYVQSQWGDWYMFGPDGRIVTGPTKWAGGLYYFDPVTYLRVDNRYISTLADGRGYLFGADGRALTGVQRWNGTYYYFDPVTYLRVDNNYVQSQWGDWYMFGPNGRIVTGAWQWYGNTYYFDPVTYLKVTNQWVGNNYYGDDGARLDNLSNKSLIVDGVLQRTDATGKVVNKTTPNFPNLSQLSFTGDLKGISKDNRKAVQVKLNLTDGTSTTAWATIKWQGNSSLAWAKKGYRVKLFKDADMTKKLKLELPGSGFATNSFNLKSCFTDPTMGLNIVNARLYQQITATRTGLADSIVAKMPNYGQVNGLPVELGINGYDQGLYVLETYHEDKLYNLNDKKTNNIALSANNDDEPSTGFYQQVGVGNLVDTTFANISPEKVDQTVVDQFDQLYQLANASDQDYARLEGKYIDVPAAIDYLAFSFAINNSDGLRKNITYISKNGSKWVFMPYDLDMTWDNSFDGSVQDINKNFETEIQERDNKLLSAFYAHHKQDIINRYKELRTSVLSTDHVTSLFKEWFNSIPATAFDNNRYLWDGLHNDDTRRKSISPDQLYQIIQQRLDSVDHFWNI
ncbi:CotH kinase family protein [Limosilactobacillus sp.]|uniref:CotH kinase family protein n=1 Tax=Limosilactobacillus sp. TaxID=2773925 RepID=UPI003EFDE7D4